jgi:hypothetical protein
MGDQEGGAGHEFSQSNVDFAFFSIFELFFMTYHQTS